MGLFTRRHAEARAPEDRALTVTSTPTPMLPALAPGQPITPSAALQIADVLACIRCLADTAASLPLISYVRVGDGGRERFDGRLADLLERPSPGSTTANFVGTVVAHLVAHGNCFVAKYRDARGVVVQMAPLAPGSVAVRLEAGEVRYSLMRPTGVSEHGPDDIVHIRGLSMDGLVGLSPIQQARQALGLSLSLATHADSFARNSGRPGGIISIRGYVPADDSPDLPVQERLKSDFTERFTLENSGRVMVVSGDSLDYQQLALSMQDADFVAQRQLSTAEIARVFRVPTFMIGAPSGDSLTYSNTESQAAAFLKFSLAPWLTLIEQAISADRDLSPRGVFAEFLVDALLRSDSKTRAEVYTAALDPLTGWMSRSEIRQRENLSPEPPETA